MKDSLKAGETNIHSYIVPEEKTVPFLFEEAELFQQMPKVLATGYLVGLMEWACMETMKPHMEVGEISLGVNINISHLAPTPPGMKVEVEVTCQEVDGQKTLWQIVARDEKDIIGKGTHERFSINGEKFAKIVEKKAAAQS